MRGLLTRLGAYGKLPGPPRTHHKRPLKGRCVPPHLAKVVLPSASGYRGPEGRPELSGDSLDLRGARWLSPTKIFW